MPDFEKFRVGSTDYNVKDASAARLYVGSSTAPEGTNIKINPNGTAAVLLEDAPEDGKQYARQDGEWTEVTGGGSTSRWNGKNVLVIGDSVSDTDFHEHPWQEQLTSMLGCTVTTHACQGATLIQMVDGKTEGTHTLPALTQQDVTGKDLIILFGGGNDAGSGVPLGQVGDTTTATLCGRLFYAVNKIYGLLDDADNLTCRVMLADYYNSGTSMQDERGTQAIEDFAHYGGLPVINLRKTSGINPYTWSLYGRTDNAHLNTDGNELIGKQIARFIENEV